MGLYFPGHWLQAGDISKTDLAGQMQLKSHKPSTKTLTPGTSPSYSHSAIIDDPSTAQG